jgi:dynein heavy chain
LLSCLILAVIPNPHDWIDPQSWKDIVLFSDLDPVFGTILKHIKSHGEDWFKWAKSENPENTTLPGGYSETFGVFSQLCLLRCFRLDRIINGVTNFIIASLGEQYVMPPVIRYGDIYEQSSATCPIVFILSAGADPQSEIQKLAEDVGFGGNKLKFLSLGQGYF